MIQDTLLDCAKIKLGPFVVFLWQLRLNFRSVGVRFRMSLVYVGYRLTRQSSDAEFNVRTPVLFF